MFRKEVYYIKMTDTRIEIIIPNIYSYIYDLAITFCRVF